MTTSPNLSPGHLLSRGWEVFQLRPGLCVITWLIYSIFNGGGSGGGGSGGGGDTDPVMLLLIVVLAFGVMAVGLLIGPPLRAGYDLTMLRLVRDDDSVQFGDLFAGFSKFGPVVITGFLFIVIVTIGTLLCLVPGLILALGLWPAFLLVMEDDLAPVDALKAAWALTDGYKGALFLYAFASSFVVLAGILACCVGLFVAGPVVQIGWAAAYDELRKAQGAAARADDGLVPNLDPLPAEKQAMPPLPEMAE